MKNRFAVVGTLFLLVTSYGVAAAQPQGADPRTMTVNVNIVPGASAASGVVTTGGSQSTAIQTKAEKQSASTEASATPTKTSDGNAPASTSKDSVQQAVPTTEDGRQDKVAMMSESDGQEKPSKETPGVAKMAVTMLFKLAIVLALAYVSILALKWMSEKRGNVAPSTRGELKVVDTIKLSPTSNLHIIDAKGKMLLLGSTAGQVNVLCELEKSEIPEFETVADAAPKTSFADYLTKYSGPTNQNNTVGRLTGLLRDCTSQMQSKRRTVAGMGTKLSNDRAVQTRGRQRKAGNVSAMILRNCAEYLEKRQNGSAVAGDSNEA